MGGISREKTREAKVSDFHIEIVVREYVVSLYVSVNDVDEMQVGESRCSVNGHAEAKGEGEGSWDVLVHKEEMWRVRGCGAVESDKVWVAEAGEDLDFIHELLDTLVAGLVQTLHSNNASILKKT